MSRTAGTIVRRKSLRLDQRKLDRAKRILGARTEAETIDQALDFVIFLKEVRDGIGRIAGTGGIRAPFEHDLEP
jgi:hypothetical protein